jgi:hypothetical protein
MHEIEYLWDHWKFNADQRIKAFNFFVVFSVFADGGVFTAIEKCVHPVVVIVIGFFVLASSVAFFLMDIRSEQLVGLSLPGIKAFEGTLSPSARIFHHDALNRSKLIRFKYAFRGLFSLQFIFGLLVVAFGTVSIAPFLAGLKEPPILSRCSR